MTGTLTVILGSMWAGKSEALLARVTRIDLARRQFALIKPAVDSRYSISRITSHDGRSYPATAVSSSSDIRHALPDRVEWVFIDEAQFFDEGLAEVVDDLVRSGVHVVAAGLDLDFQGNPFPTMIPLVFTAEHLQKLFAVCEVCGEDAARSQRMVGGRAVTTGDVVHVGGSESYEPRCRACFEQIGIVYPEPAHQAIVIDI